MKKLLFLLCILIKGATAQPSITWHKIFDTTYTANTGSDNIIEMVDSSYTAFGGINSKKRIIKLNKNGDTLWTKTFNANWFLRRFIKTNDGGYAMLGYINNWLLIKTDSMGDTLWTKPYPQLSDPRCLIQTSDGGYAIGSYQGGYDVIKTDATGLVHWQSAAVSIHVQGFIECYNKNYLVFGNSGFNPLCYKAGLIDSMGALVWVNYYGNVSFQGADLESIVSAVQLPDSSFILGCSIDTVQQGQYNLLKVNYSDGVLMDSVKLADIQQYDYTYLNFLNDSNLLIRTRSYIHKTTPSYTSIWKKVLPFFANSIEQTTDNGFIAVGGNNLQGTLSRIEYAKLDSLGNIYNFQSIPELAINELRVYPNPAVNQLAASPPTFLQGRGEVTVTIYDMLGKIQLQQKLIPQGDLKVEVNDLPSGMYMLQIKQADRLFNGRFVKE